MNQSHENKWICFLIFLLVTSTRKVLKKGLKMTSVVYLIFFITAVNVLTLATSTPANYMNQDKQNFIQRNVELIQDKSVEKFLREPRWDSFLIRDRRQVEQLDESVTTADQLEDPQQAGFFDRAAQFVMELLQRFLKWINSSDN